MYDTGWDLSVLPLGYFRDDNGEVIYLARDGGRMYKMGVHPRNIRATTPTRSFYSDRIYSANGYRCIKGSNTHSLKDATGILNQRNVSKVILNRDFCLRKTQHDLVNTLESKGSPIALQSGSTSSKFKAVDDLTVKMINHNKFIHKPEEMEIELG